MDGTWSGVRGFGLLEERGEGVDRVAEHNNYRSAMLVVGTGFGTRLECQLSLREQTMAPTSSQRWGWMKGRMRRYMGGREEDDLVIR